MLVFAAAFVVILVAAVRVFTSRAMDRAEAAREEDVPRAEAAREEEAPRVDVARAPGRGGARCPYCHAPAALEEAVVCAACAARHHGACWDEHGECSACGARERFASLERSPGRERPDRSGDLKA